MLRFNKLSTAFISVITLEVLFGAGCANDAFSSVGGLQSFKPVVAYTRHLRTEKKWHSKLLERNIPLRVYFHAASSGAGDHTPVIYVQNTAALRMGTEPDASILQSFIDDGYVVITADYQNDTRTVSPAIEKDLWELRADVLACREFNLWDDVDFKIRQDRAFVVPSGWRIAGNIPFWNFLKHGQHGSAEDAVAIYNQHIGGVVSGRPDVARPDQMMDSKGHPLNFDYYLDIIYPSRPIQSVPAMVTETCNLFTDPSLGAYGWGTDKKQTYGLMQFQAIGYPFRGYAAVSVDHGHCPIYRAYPDKGIKNYTMIPLNGASFASASIRYLRAHSGQYHLSGTIGATGISRASYTRLRLAEPGIDNNPQEHSKLKASSNGSPPPQPWQGFRAQADAVHYGVGWAYSNGDLVTAKASPALIPAGTADQYGGRYHDNFIARISAVDPEVVEFKMQGMGHTMPFGYDDVLGVDRYELFCAFFDYHLKPDAYRGPVVLYIAPRNGAQDVTGTQAVQIQFAGRIQVDSVLHGGIKITRHADGGAVDGTWTASHGQTQFSFVPKNNWSANQQYDVRVTDRVRGQNGKPVHRAVELCFNCVDTTSGDNKRGDKK